MARVVIGDQAKLLADLNSPSPYISATAAQMAAAIEQHPPTDIVVKLYGNTYKPAGEVRDYLSVQCAFPRETVPAGTIVLKGSDPLADLALTCETTVVPITIEVGMLRWSGRIDIAHDRYKDGQYCLDSETEILTSGGFKRNEELRGDEQVLTLNMETGLSEWQPMLSVHRFDVQDIEALSMEVRGHSSLSTMNHRWPVRVAHESRWQSADEITIRESAELNLNHRLIPSAACGSLPAVAKYEDAQVELVAWFITEGTIRKNNNGTMSTGVRIGQSAKVNPTYVDRIRACLTTLWGSPTEVMTRSRGTHKKDWQPEWRERSGQNGGMTCFDLNTVAGRTLIEIAPDRVASGEFIAALTAAQLRLFVETCIDADGSRNSGNGQVSFTQKSADRVAPVQMAATLLGMPTAIAYQSRGIFAMTFYRGRGTTQPQRHTESSRRVRYSGTVWCPKTENGTWLARRNGTVYFTGNTVECELLHDKAWLTRILCWPNYLLPIQVQFGSVAAFGVPGVPIGGNRAVFIGPAITCIKTLVAEQAFRIQSGLWELVNNLVSFPPNLNVQAWFGTLLMQGGLSFNDFMRSLTTPIYVVPTNPIFDTSPWVSFNGRMDEIFALISPTVKDCGLTVDVNLWLPGEPQPDAFAAALNLLQVPTIVVDVHDRMGVTGATGTFLDGLERDLVDLQGSMFGEITAPFLNPNNEYAPPGINIAPLLGVHFHKPWCLFTDHPRGGLREFDFAHHHPLAYTTITGGKSPKWMNDLINATLEWLVDSLMIIIGFTGVPGSIFDGMFNDIFLAFQLTENFGRRVKLGPYGFPEKFFPTGSGSYTLDAFFSQKAAMWDTRGYVSAQFWFDNGYPYEVGRDCFPGALASCVRRGKLYTDYIENVTITDDRQNRVKVLIQVGDGKALEAPITKIQRKLTGFMEAANILMMSQ
jgi:hypothetical protein